MPVLFAVIFANVFITFNIAFFKSNIPVPAFVRALVHLVPTIFFFFFKKFF